MSQDDFKMGQQGLRWSPGMDRQDYDRGKAAREDAEYAAAHAPKASVDGPGIVGLVMAPILAIMYPVAGVIMLAAIVATAWLVGLLPDKLTGVKVLLFVAAAIAALFPALKAEHKASESKLYRGVRSVLRLFWLTFLVVGMLIGADDTHDFDSALRHAPPNFLLWTLVIFGLMVWLFPKFDRLFFPVRDAYTIKQEKKFAGMSTVEIDEVKTSEFRGRLTFTVAWVAGTALIGYLVPHGIPVAVIALGVFGVCWVVRKQLFFRKAAL